MAKTTMTLDELSAWFTEKVRKQTGASDAYVTVQYKLTKPDQHGKLWSDSIIVNPGKASMEAALADVSSAYREALDSIDLA